MTPNTLSLCFRVSNELGASRVFTKDGNILYGVGVELVKVRGDSVQQGEVWATVHHDEPRISNRLQSMIEDAIQIKETTEKICTSKIVKIIGPNDSI